MPEINSLVYRGYPVQDLAEQLQLRGGGMAHLARRVAECVRTEILSGRRAGAPQPQPGPAGRDSQMLAHGASDGRVAHGGQLPRRGRPRAGKNGRRRKSQPRRGHAGENPDDDRSVLPPAQRAGFHPAARRLEHRGEFFPRVFRQSARAGGRARVRGVAGALCRARVQRLHVFRARGGVESDGHFQRGHRRASRRSKASCTAARTKP